MLLAVMFPLVRILPEIVSAFVTARSLKTPTPKAPRLPVTVAPLINVPVTVLK